MQTTEPLVLNERVKNTLRLGESHFREFKSAFEGPPDKKAPRRCSSICQDIGEALVAFANADGGELIIGVEDNGTLSGVPHHESDVQMMLRAPTTHVHADSELPLLHSCILTLDGTTVVFFSVSKGSKAVYQLPDGRCVKRHEASSQPESVERILFKHGEAQSRSFDAQFVDGAQVTDLDLAEIQGMADAYLRGMTPEKYLQQLGLAEYTLGGLILRRAAVLLFATDIRRWHARSQVRILKVNGDRLLSGPDYNVVSDERVEDNIMRLLRRSWEALRSFLASKTEFDEDARFEQKYVYPEWACREALVNAIAHRDYNQQRGIEVFIFSDRMEIRSPGALLSTISIEQLLRLENAHESRNSFIARILSDGKIIRELGEGMKRIFSLMEERDLQPPELASDDTTFVCTLYQDSVFSEQQKAWLGLFESSRLTKLQKRIVVAGMNGRPLSPNDIYRAMKTTDRDTYDREVTGLRKAGVLDEICTNPEATRRAKVSKRPKETIPRFKVTMPSANQGLRTIGQGPRTESVGTMSESPVYTRQQPERRGTIKALKDSFGFIGTDEGDIFFHLSAVQVGRFDELIVGQIVEYRAVLTERGKQASFVRGL